MSLAALKGRKLSFVCNRPNPELEAKIRAEIEPKALNYVVASGSSVHSLCRSIKHGGIDAVLVCDGFMSHLDVNNIKTTCKKQDVPFVPVGKGRWAEITRSIERHKSMLGPLEPETPVEPEPANDQRNAWDTQQPPGVGAVPPKGTRGKSISSSTKWATEQLVWLQHWVEGGIQDGDTLARMIEQKFGIKRTSNAVRDMYAIYFGLRLDGSESQRSYRLPLPDDFEEVKVKIFSEPEEEEEVMQSTPPPELEPLPMGAPAPVIQMPTPPAPPASPPAPAPQASLEVRPGGNQGTLVIDVKGPQGEMVVETKRSFSEIVSWLMGMS